jgi:hypothetical protein
VEGVSAVSALETLVGPVGYALLAGIGAGALISVFIKWAIQGLRTSDTLPPFFIAGLAFGVMLGFCLGVLVK